MSADPPRRTVLLVEDDESIRRLVRVNLEMTGFEVVEATYGQEGLVLAALHHPDAVVLDLMMPDLDGGTVLAQLRGSPESRDIPVVVITGKPDVSGELRELIGEGNLVRKPFDPDHLVHRIRDLVGDVNEG